MFIKNFDVKKGNHYCMFCDSDADFVLQNKDVHPMKEFPMCKSCASDFVQLINEAIAKDFAS